MYCGNTRIEEQEIYELLYVARKYLVTDLVHRCLQRLKTRMSVDNVCIILSYADDEDTVTLCLTYIFRYPDEVLKSEGFKQLPVENLKQIISSNKLSVKEEDIFDAVITWSEQECIRKGIDVLPENQGKLLGDVLNFIRYGRMDRGYVMEVCKRFLPIELYLEIVENIALQSETENNTLLSEGQKTPEHVATGTATKTLHSSGACGRDVIPRNFPSDYLPMEVLDSSVTTDSAPVDSDNSCSPVPSVFSRSSDEFTISRFPSHAYASGKLYDNQLQDSISFITSDNVQLVGIFVFGSCGSPGVYQIHLEILQDLNGLLSLVHSSEHELETDGSKKIYELNIPPLNIAKENVFTVRSLIRGPPSYFGTNGTAEVRRNGVSVFFITNDDGFGLNSTTAEGGQFPGLIIKKQV